MPGSFTGCENLTFKSSSWLLYDLSRLLLRSPVTQGASAVSSFSSNRWDRQLRQKQLSMRGAATQGFENPSCSIHDLKDFPCRGHQSCQEQCNASHSLHMSTTNVMAKPAGPAQQYKLVLNPAW